MVIVDMKGELYSDTRYFLQTKDYEVIAVDFTSPEYSNHYNFLQPVLDALNRGERAKAATAVRDMAAMLVEETQSNEQIWVDGARAVLTVAALICACDNMEHPEFQNLANVKQFLTYMCEPCGEHGLLPLNLYLDALPESHPAKLSMGIPRIAPSRMQGSFFTSALTVLELFSDPAIHAMTSDTDFDPELSGERKRAIFLILPDHKEAYYQIAALFVYQQYQMLADQSIRCGGRLPRRVHFFCDEFGNFVKIPSFQRVISVSGGRGILWHLFLQATSQLDDVYGEKVGSIIRSNCETWVYLHSDDSQTLEELSKRLGSYTIKVPGVSTSSSGGGTQMSASYNLAGRPLMFPDELNRRIQRPYQLVLTRKKPAIVYAPDLSETIWNQAFGMGDEGYNQQLAILRAKDRQKPPGSEPCYWGIWENYRKEILAAEAAHKRKGT